LVSDFFSSLLGECPAEQSGKTKMSGVREMTIESPTIGLRHTQSILVVEQLTVPSVAQVFTGFADMPLVFATAFLVGFVEWTCIEALRPFIKPGQETVGIHVDLSHRAATPVGMTVTAEIELIEIEGRTLLFEVKCRDEAGSIGEGQHRRAIVNLDRFKQRLAEKSAKVSR
jgi:fluoroacetyl-CoA thioesterase